MQKISNDMEFSSNTLSHSNVTDAIKNTTDSIGNIISFSRRSLNNITIIKKDGTKEKYNVEKVISAIKKSAARTLVEFSDKQIKDICAFVNKSVLDMDKDSVAIAQMHNIVESALQALSPQVAESYRNYRNYKTDFVSMLDKVYQESQRIMYIGDKENANADSTLVSTKRSLIFNELNKELYKKFFLTVEDKQAIKEGYIYIHDMSARRDTMNCCLFDVAAVLKGGFEMGNIWYNEPKSLDVAFDVIGDIVMAAASQQYGGFTVPEVDKILAPYAKKTYDRQYDRYICMGLSFEKAKEEALKDVQTTFEQGFQGWEYKFNTVASSRGDYPFITVTTGLGQDEFEVMATLACLKTRQGGQGKKECKKPVLFPKIVFLYDEELHGEGKPLEKLFQAGVECSQKTMYPDWLSLSGEGYVASMYKKYKRVVSPMGCRAFLSPWFERGGAEPADENDKPIFVGRFNIGAISLHLPMIYAKAQQESRDFYEVLDYYMELIRKIHVRTYEYLGEMRASVNPLAYCEGGFLGGHLKYNDKIKPLLKSATASFGITALNELQELHNGKSLVEDGNFAIEVMEYINKKVAQFKKQDGNLYALYGTPAENLCGLQVKQFRKKYGIVGNVSDKPYVSNSFHCHVSEQISPIEKQDCEKRFWDLMNGGKIQYVRYPISYNKKAVESLIRRAMKMGFYEGVNLSLSYCDDCGHQELNMDVCPKCGSKNLTKIDRMNGYLAYSRVKGDSRLADHKMEEIKDRVSM
ncbi:MAG: anaerobic ribonucleoside-triphosphate reductase [Candidatus Gastranaerophilales bacterium]|nr:anaerobic ribonucleoside-triphosphate reductase [Candidatus Gastranaerophilales bacterium]